MSANFGNNDISTSGSITADGSVGIGTASPDVKLHIEGTAPHLRQENTLASSSISHYLYSDGVNLGGLVGYGTSYAGGSIFGVGASGVGLFSNNGADLAVGTFGGAGNIILGTNSTERVRIDGFGNVGIGKPSPSEKLDVNGKIKSTLSYTAMHSATNLAVGWYTVAVNYGNRAIGRFGLTCSTSGRHQGIIFYASHFYGLGNQISVLHNNRYSLSNPVAKLRIKEGGTYDGCLLQVYIDDAINTPEVYLLNDNINTAGWVVVDWVPDGTDPGGVANFAALTNVAAEVDLDTMDFGTTGQTSLDGPVVINEGGSNNDFRVEGDADQNLLFTDASTDRVGIGTPSPSEKLHVSGNALIDGPRPLTLSSSSNIASSKKGSSGGWEFSHDALGSAGTNLGGFGWYGTDDALNRYWIGPAYNSTNSIHLLPNGNCGIGTYAPSVKLDVNGVIAASGGNSNQWNTAYGWGDHGTQGYLIPSFTPPINLNQVLAYNGSNWINKTFDISLIEKGSIPFGGYSSSQMGYYYSWNSNSEAVINDGGNNINFRVESVSDTHLLYVDGSTNSRVGIGTPSPSYKLDVNGTFSANSINVNDQFTFPTTDGSVDQVLVTDGSGVLTWQDQANAGTFHYLNIKKSSLTENVNQLYASRQAIRFDSEVYKSTIYSHSNVTNPERITVSEDGFYKLSANVGLDNTGANRAVIRMSVFKNGTEITETRTSTYSRGAGLGDEFNLHIDTILQLSSSDYLEIYAWREYADQTNNVDTVVGECEFILHKVSENDYNNVTSEYNFPNTDGEDGQVLSTNGSGSVVWEHPRSSYIMSVMFG